MISTICSIRYKRILSVILVLVTLCSVFLCSCSKKDVSPSVTSGRNQSSDTDTKRNDTSSSSVLFTNISADDTVINPYILKDQSTVCFLSLVFEPALIYNDDGSFSPSIIKSWKYDPAERTYDLTVQKGIFFHDDTYGPVTSSDIEEIIKYLKRSDSVYSEYSDSVLDIKKEDDYRLKIKVKENNQDLLFLLRFPVVPKELLMGETGSETPVTIGTGPYTVEGFAENGDLILKRSDNWWKGRSGFEYVTGVPVKNEAEAIKLFQEDEIDCLMTGMVNAMNFCGGNNVRTYSASTSFFDCLVPNLFSPTMKNKSLIKALYYSIDRKRIIKQGLGNMGFPAGVPISSSLAYLNESSFTFFDTALAQRYFQEAGYTYFENYYRDSSGRPLQLNILYSESADTRYRSKVLYELKNSLAELGIYVSFTKVAPDALIDSMKNPNYDLCFMSFNLKSNNDISFIFENGYCETDDEVLMETVRSLRTTTDVQKGFAKLYEELQNDVPVIGLYFRSYSLFVSRKMTGVGSVKYPYLFSDIANWKKAI